MNYNDPRWYEEEKAPEKRPSSVPHPSGPTQPASDDFERYPFLPAPESHMPSGHNGYPAPQVQQSSPKRNILGQVILLGALVVIAFWGGWFCREFFGNSFTPNGESQKYANLVQEAWQKIDEHYVGRNNVNYQEMAYAAINNMVETLGDPGHTRFMDPQTVKQENEQLSGKFVGIGIYLHQDPDNKQLIITAPIPGSPAEKADIKPGDVILSIDGTEMKDKTTAEASKLIQGEEGTSLTLKIQRAGEEQPREITVSRAEIIVPNVIMHYMPENKIAHIHVLQFAQDVSGQLRDAVTEAKKKGATSIILDLRDNPGGYLEEAVKITSLFLEKGVVLQQQDSTGKRTAREVSGNPLDATIPLVVLVNENSASASEIVAGSLQENNRAIVLGKRTFGTGTVLEQFNLEDGSALYLGVREWLTPDGNFIRMDPKKPGSGGITPDKEVSLPENSFKLTPNEANQSALSDQQILESSDTQLIEAIKHLNERS